jgi:AcrR family transcriptional regulator
MTNTNEQGVKAPGRRERKAAEMRDRIFRAAIELIAERGLASVTVEQITERADVGKGTFFNYFPNKEAVLTYFGTNQVSDLQEAMAAGEIQGTSRERVVCVLELLAERELTPELARGLFVSALSEHSVKDRHGPNIWGMQEILVRIIEEGQRNGELRPDLDSGECALYLLGQYFLAILAWCSGFRQGSLKQIVTQYADLSLEGIALDPR